MNFTLQIWQKVIDNLKSEMASLSPYLNPLTIDNNNYNNAIIAYQF